MPTVTLNNKEYEGVDPKFLEAISRRLQAHLLRIRSQRIDIDSTMVGLELQRLYTPAIAQKPWFNDFVASFCRARKIR